MDKIFRSAIRMYRLGGIRLSSSAQVSDIQSHWPSEIKNFLQRENITKPTMIQEKTWLAASSNRDLVAIARTGSGKTLGFAIPAVMKILDQIRDNVPTKASVLVLEPTRELANQTADVFNKFSNLGVRCITLVGGSARNIQVNALERNAHHVYIATPGRLNDLRESKVVDLSSIEYLVLDEADRMLDMGFEPQVRAILNEIPSNRQTLMWSATWPDEVQDLAREFTREHDFIAVDSEKLKANPNIKQTFEICEPHSKVQLLVKNLNKLRDSLQHPRSLVFVNTKRGAEFLISQLMRNRFKAVSLHGDKSQNQRDRALRLFRDKYCDIMVATDVAARGLDINDITHVINYDMPTCIEDYVHRIGRTARHEKEGVSISFITEDDANIVPKLIRVLRETNQPIPEELNNLGQYQTNSRSKKRFDQRFDRGYDQRFDQGYNQQRSWSRRPSNRFNSSLEYDG